MTVRAKQRQFTAEVRKHSPASLDEGTAAGGETDAGARHRELMQAIDDIRRRLDGASQPAAAPERRHRQRQRWRRTTVATSMHRHCWAS
jgi:hypothetical protein